MTRLLPRSLAGQLGLLVAVALFVAQAINFGLLLRERRDARFYAVIVPAVTRIADAADRVDAGRQLADPRRSGARAVVELRTVAPPAAPADRRLSIEQMVARGLADSGMNPLAVIATIRDIRPNDPLPGVHPRRAERLRRFGSELRISAQLADGRWLSLATVWPRADRGLVWQLIAQTLILYVVVLVPLLLAGRRIARPLRALAQAARDFRPGNGTPPLPERGSGDVRAVIGAYNALSLRVNAMLDEKDRMLGAIGHDLRTPLAALRVRIESVEDEDDRSRMADIIDEMNRTLDDILSLARLGRPSEPAVDVDLSALIDAVVEDFRDLGHAVAFEETERLRMRLRPALMRRAVRNLIENAVKYAGGAEVRLDAAAGEVAIEVADRGPGIPPEKLGDVFDAFTRLESSRNRETGGIGLGLSLARAIVREAGGEISLANREGGGLVARIALPRRP